MNSRAQLLLAFLWLLLGVALVATPRGLSLLDGVVQDLETVFRMFPRPESQTPELQEVVTTTRLQQILAFSVAAVIATLGIVAFVAATAYRERWRRFLRVFQNAVGERSARSSRTTLADEMAIEYERSTSRSSLVLFIAVLLAFLVAWVYPDRAIVAGALVVCALFFATSLRHFLLRYRIERRLFGSSEHEVRTLLAFVLEQPDSGGFSDGGRPKPAFVAAVPDNTAPAGLAEGSGA